MRRPPTGWEQGYHMGKSHTLHMQQDKQYQGYQTNRRGACPDCSEEDEQDDCDDGDNHNQKKKNKKIKPQGIFTQSWAERYNMDNLANLK